MLLYSYRYRAPPGVFLPVTSAGCVVLVGLDGCEVRLCGPSAFVRPRVPMVSRLPPCLFTGTETMRRNEFRTWRARGPCCVNGGGVVHVRGSREHSQPPREVGARVS